MTKDTSTTSHTHNVLTAVTGTTATDCFSDKVASFVNSLDCVQQFNDRYNTDPASELLARIDDWQQFDHTEPVAALVQKLGAKQVWAVLSQYQGRFSWTGKPGAAVLKLIYADLLPGDERIFIDGAAHPEVLKDVFADRHFGRHPLDLGLAVNYAMSIDASLAYMQRVVFCAVDDIDASTLDVLRSFVAKRIAAGDVPKLRTPADILPNTFLTETQVDELLSRGTLTDTVVALSFGLSISNAMFAKHKATLMTWPQTAAATVSIVSAWNSRTDFDSLECVRMFKAQVAGGTELAYSWLSETAAQLLVSRLVLSPVQVVEFISQFPRIADSWLKSLTDSGDSAPVVELVQRGVVDVKTIFHFAIYSHVPDSVMQSVLRVPGLPSVVLGQLNSSGASINRPSHEQTNGALALAFAAFGEDKLLWESFLTASSSSPFRNSELGFIQASEVLLTRWAEAAKRRSGR